MVHSFLALAPFLIASAAAANDWSQPCLQGVCSYDVDGSAGSASGTMKIWGSNDAISDVTTAAGWTILSCDANATSQDIRLVCTDETAGCSHLYQNGAEDTIVRLPQNCSASPFARVAKAYVPTDQSIPPSMTSQINSSAQVKALSIDTNWSAVNSSQKGNISLAIQGASVPGQTGDIDISSVTPPQRRSRLVYRDSSSIVDNATSTFNSFNKSLEQTSPPIVVNQDFNIINSSLACSNFDISLDADVNPGLQANVTYGIAAQGTLIPPEISDFMLFVDLDANITGSLDLKATASGKVDSGTVTLFTVGIPGLDIPEILTLGPSFKITGQITTDSEVDVDMTVDLAYKVSDAKLIFPPSKGASSGTFAPQDSPLKLSVSPTITAQTTIVAHLTPVIDVGINAFGNDVAADVFLNLDATATLILNATASGTNIGSNQTSTGSQSNSAQMMSDKATSTQIMSSASSSTTMSSEAQSSALTSCMAQCSPMMGLASQTYMGAQSMSTQYASTQSQGQQTNTTGNIQGCVTVDAGFTVNAGATGTFFSIFNDSDKVTLFSKNFQLFSKCFGTAASLRRRFGSKRRAVRFPRSLDASMGVAPTLESQSVSAREVVSSLTKRVALTCPPNPADAAVSVVNEVIEGAVEKVI